MRHFKFFLVYFLLFFGGKTFASCPGSPNFTFTTPWCVNTAVTFNNTSTGSGVSTYTWDWGDASSNTVVGTNASQTHTFTATGTYQVKLIRVFSAGCKDSVTHSINIIANAVAAPTFSFTPNNGCSSNPVSFTNTTNPNAGLTFSWNFGDPASGNKNTSTNNNPTHIFSATGNGGTTSYTVTLTSTNASGCANSATHTITVGNRPDAALADSNIFFPFNNCGFASLSNSSYYLAVTNNSTTTGSNASYSINWGDGTADFNSANFTQTNHTYPALGLYDIVLTVVGTNGCEDTAHYQVVNLSNPSVGISGPGSTNGCAPQTFVFTMQLDSANINYTSYRIDFGDGTPNIFLTPPIAGTTISHTFNNTSCGQPGNQFTVQIVAKNLCDSTTGTVNNIKISSKPTPEFSSSPEPGCVNSPITFTNQTTAGCFITGSSSTSATSYVWNWGDGSANTSTTSSAAQAHTYTATGTYNVTLTASNPCGASTVTHPVHILVPPLAKFTNTPPGCAPTTLIFTNQSTGDSLSYNWSVNSGNGVSFTGGTSSSSTNPHIQFTIAGTYTITLTTSNSCGNSTHDTIITVKSPPVITLATIPGGCTPYSVTPAASFDAGGGTITNYAWTMTGGSPSSAATSAAPNVTYNAAGNYTVQIIAKNECGPDTAKQIFAVTPQPTANAGADKLMCEGTSVTIGTASTTDYTYSWSSVPAGFSSSVSDPAVSPASTTTFVVTATLNGCSKNDSVKVTVNPFPTVSAGSDQTVCANAAQFNLSGSPAGGTWNGTGITNATNGTFKPSVAGTGTFTETYSYTDAVTTCSTTATVNITVSPLPAVFAGTDFTACNAPGTVTLSTFSPAGGTWSGTGVTAGGIFTPATAGVGAFNLIYSFTDGFGCSNKDTLVATVINSTPASAGNDSIVCLNTAAFNFSGFSPAGGTWTGTGITNGSSGTFDAATAGVGTFTLTYSNGVGTCTTTDTKTIEVQALPVVAAGSDQTMCIDAGTFNLSGFSPAGGTWSGTGITNAALGTFKPTTAGAGTFTLTYSFTDAATGCNNTDTKTITVNVLPVVDAGTGTIYCNTPTTVTLAGFSPAGGVWTGNGITNASGTFDPSTSGLGKDTLTYTFTDGNGCVNADTIINTVQAPAVANAGVDDTVCISDAAFDMTGFSPATGTWSGTGITDALLGTFDPSTAGTGSFTLTYSYGTGTCLTTDTKKIKVNALPTVSAGADQVACVNSPSFSITSGTPSGGTWSGTGITNASGIFDPATAGTGTFTVTYSYTDPVTHCSNTSTKQITVNPLPVVDAGTGFTVCDQPIPVTLADFSPAGGTWSGTGVSGAGVYDPSVGGIGTFTLTYSFTGGANCTATDTIVMHVIAPSVANAGSNDTICINGGQHTLTGFSPASGGTWTGTGIINSSGIFDPLVSGVGTFTLTYSYGAGNCLTASTKIVKVNGLTAMNAGPAITTCISTAAFNLTGFSPAGGTWGGTGITNAASGTFNPSAATAGTHTLTYSYTDPLTHCTDTRTRTVTVEALPVVSFTNPNPSCINAPTSFTNNTSGATVYAWNFGDGNTSTAVSPSNTYTATGTYTVHLIAATANGCKDSTTNQIDLVQAPVANFTLFPDTGCAPLAVTFTDNSSGSFISYNWNFGNGSSSALPDPGTVTFQEGAHDTTYVIDLAVTNLCATVHHFDTITVYHSSITANFGTNFSVGCSPFHVLFNSLTTGLATYFKWDFGDGTTGTGSNPPMHTYFYTGSADTTYFIKLIAYNHCNSDTVIRSIKVLPNTVTAFFNTSNVSGCAPYTATFTDFSSGGTNVSWDFGDGNLSTQQSPSHTYASAGTYTVYQYVNNGCGYDTATVVITVYPPAGLGYTFAPNPVCINQNITFTNTSTAASGFSWNFGDGSTSTLTSPVHTFSSGGTFTVTLIGTSTTFGCVDSIKKVVTIYAPPVATFSPSAIFGCLPLSVNFSNTSTNANFYTWSFGNGNTSALTSPSQTYLSTGVYTVSLLAQNLNGCKDSATVQINVYPVPTAVFTTAPSYGCGLPQNVTFTNASVGATSYTWDYGDGQTGITTNGAVTYISADTFAVQLIASNSFGCKDTTDDSFIVYPKPVVSFSPQSAEGCDPMTVQFNNTTVDGTTYSWHFSDGDSSLQMNPYHIFYGVGVYGATLTATSGQACTTTQSVPALVTVHPTPVAGFTYAQQITDNVPDGTIAFTNTSTGATNYTWNFGNGDSSVTTDAIHQYQAVGSYTASLIAYNLFGCADTTSKIVVPDYFEALFVPNALIPTSQFPDLQVFLPKGKSLKEYRLQIYDTWGALMWESTSLNADGSPAEGWDGTYNGNACQQDVYVWKIEAMFINGDTWQGQKSKGGKYSTTGSVHLIR